MCNILTFVSKTSHMKELIYLEGIIQSVAGVVVGGGRFDVLSLKFGLQIGIYYSHKASLAAQLVKNLPAMWETWVGSLGWKDPLEKGKASHSSILAWRIPRTTAHGVAKSRTRLSNFHFHICSLKTLTVHTDILKILV